MRGIVASRFSLKLWCTLYDSQFFYLAFFSLHPPFTLLSYRFCYEFLRQISICSRHILSQPRKGSILPTIFSQWFLIACTFISCKLRVRYCIGTTLFNLTWTKKVYFWVPYISQEILDKNQAKFYKFDLYGVIKCGLKIGILKAIWTLYERYYTFNT